MFLDAVLTDSELLGDVGVGQSPHDGVQYLLLTRRKVRHGRILRKLTLNLGRDHPAACGDGP